MWNCFIGSPRRNPDFDSGHWLRRDRRRYLGRSLGFWNKGRKRQGIRDGPAMLGVVIREGDLGAGFGGGCFVWTVDLADCALGLNLSRRGLGIPVTTACRQSVGMDCLLRCGIVLCSSSGPSTVDGLCKN